MKTNREYFKEILRIFVIVFMPYIGIFILIRKKPYERNINIIGIIYCIIMSILLFIPSYNVGNKSLSDAKDSLIGILPLLSIGFIVFYNRKNKRNRIEPNPSLLNNNLKDRDIVQNSFIKRTALKFKYKFRKIFNPKIIEEATNGSIKILFTELDMNHKLESFIINNTKKYDDGELSPHEYNEKLNLFLYYINEMDISFIEFDTIKNPIARKKLEEYAEILNGKMNLNVNSLSRYIDKEKYNIYVKNLEEKLNVDKVMEEDEIINKYVEYYGDKSIESNNIIVISEILGKDISYTMEKIQSHYDEIQKVFKMKKIEDSLFGFEGEQIRTLEYIDKLNGFEFEDYLEELFKTFGYDVEELPYSNDYGADLIISKGVKRIVIQAKNYTGNVGNTAVQESISAKAYYNCDIAMVITNSYYTKNAIEMAKSTGVILVDRDELEKILNNGSLYFASIVNI